MRSVNFGGLELLKGFTKHTSKLIDIMKNQLTPKVICVEGNIGCGKTTFLQSLAKYKEAEVCFEPVHKWQNLHGNNLLEYMYKDSKRWSHLFQTYVQLTMLENHLHPTSKLLKVLERSFHSARHCFVENLYQSQKMSNPEYTVYKEWYETLSKKLNVDVDLYIYLQTDPTVLHKRIQTRARHEEAEIPLEYLKSLHNVHEEWLINNGENLGGQVIVINADADLQEMQTVYETFAAKIVNDFKNPDSNRFFPPVALQRSNV